MCLTLLLLALFPLGALADEGDTGAEEPVIDYHITIQLNDGDAVPVTSANKDNFFGYCGSIAYDANLDTVTITMESFYNYHNNVQVTDVTITGDGNVHLVLETVHSDGDNNGCFNNLIVQNVGSFIAINNTYLYGCPFATNLTIQNAGDVRLSIGSSQFENRNPFAASNSLQIINCNNVTIDAFCTNEYGSSVSHPVSGIKLIIDDCTGDVTIKGNNLIRYSSDFSAHFGNCFTISTAGAVALTGVDEYSIYAVDSNFMGPISIKGSSVTSKLGFTNSSSYAAAPPMIKSASDVELSNFVSYDSYNNPVLIDAVGDVHISGQSNSTLNDVNITCGGTVTIESTFSESSWNTQYGHVKYTPKSGGRYKAYRGDSKDNALPEAEPTDFSRDFVEVSDKYLRIKPAKLVTVKGGTAGIVSATASQTADEEGGDNTAAVSTLTAFPNEETIRITANDPATFIGWKVTKGGAILQDSTAPETTFTMPDGDVTIEAQYAGGSSGGEEIRGGGDDGILAGVVVGTAAAWGAYEAGTGIYRMKYMRGIPLPTTRAELALLIWRRADEPEPESTALYDDIDEDDTDLQKAAHWMVEQELMDEKKDNNFKPGRHVTKLRVCVTWDKARQKGLID